MLFWRRGAQSPSQGVGKRGSDLINRQEISEAIREEKNIHYPWNSQCSANELGEL